MDSAQKQTAVVAEATVGTTPATPGFKICRDIRVSGSPQRSNARSPERRSDRMAANMYTGLNSFPKSIEFPWVRDAATDILWESVMCGTWATNVLKNASSQKSFSLEERYEGGATDPYRRLAGCFADSLSVSFRPGSPGTMSFGIKALAETAATTAIAGATYASPTPAYDPTTPVDIVVTSLFGISSPKVMGFSLNIQNNMYEQYKFGSASPFDIGLGMFDVSGQVQLYFSQSSDYSTFMTRQTGLAFDLTLGATTLFKDQLQANSVDVWNPDVDDPGQTGVHIVTLNFLCRYNSSDAAALKLTRLVA